MALCPQVLAIAAAGVSAAQVITEAARGRRVVVAFDQDYLVNEAVCLALARLLARRATKEGTLMTTEIAAWPSSYKGID